MKQSFVVGLPFGTRLILTTDLDAALRQVEVRQQRLEHPAPVLYAIAGIMRADARAQFAEGGDPAWKPLAPSTLAAKIRARLPAKTAKGRVPTRLKQNGNFGAANILIATGVLRDSWSRKGAKGAVEEVNEATGTVNIGSSIPYAAAHQSGRAPGLAARPVVITGDARRKIVGAVEGFFAEDAGASNNRFGADDYDFSE